MSLSERVKELSTVLAKTPGLEDDPSLESARDELLKAIEQFQEEHASLLDRQNVQALDLIACIRNARKNSAEWLSNKSPGRHSYLKGSQIELEEFAREALSHGLAKRLIDELTGEQDRYARLLQSLVNLSEERLEIKLNGIEDGEMIRFCESNEIKISRTAKNPFNRTKTIVNIRRRVEELKEYLKLSQVGS